MISLLVGILVALILVGLFTWLIQTFVPAPDGMAAKIKMAVIYVIWVVFIVWVLYDLAAAFGGYSFGPRGR